MLTSERLRVVVADDHPLARERLQRILELEHDVVATVSDGASAVSAVVRLDPDVLVCDVSMPGRSGFDVARELQRLETPTKIVFVTMHAEPAYVVEALRLGVLGYVLKSVAGSELSQAVRSAAERRTFVSARLRGTCSQASSESA